MAAGGPGAGHDLTHECRLLARIDAASQSIHCPEASAAPEAETG